jgi:uncharacterized protein YjlB
VRATVELNGLSMTLTVVENEGSPARVLIGGSDGILITIGAGGIVVLPPEGPGDPELLTAFKSIYSGLTTVVQIVSQLGRCLQLERDMARALQEKNLAQYEQYAAQYEADKCGSVSRV